MVSDIKSESQMKPAFNKVPISREGIILSIITVITCKNYMLKIKDSRAEWKTANKCVNVRKKMEMVEIN